MKRLSTVLMITLVMMLAIGSLAYAATTQQEQAEVLNDMSILKGNENGYNLSGKLRRSEAATLIVRMLGEEKNVISNKSDYYVTAFSDVKNEDWFSPYVGYCYRNGIILGYPDGTFKPNEYISEKSFGQLVLGVMDYKSGADFNWETVKLTMYNKGLVSDISYTVDTNDNMNYTRGEAVQMLYNALSQKKKNSEKTVTDILIDKKVTTESKAKKYGFYKEDELKTKIKSVEVENANTVRIQMNEYIIVDADEVNVMANEVAMKITSFETKGKDIIIEVDDEFYNERNFKIVIESLYDEDGYEVTDLEEEFEGIEREAIESKYFRISKIKPLSSEMLEVYFTQPVDESAQQVLLYEVYKNGALYFEGGYKTLEIEMNSVNEKGIILIAKQHKFEENSKYEVVIKSDLKSKYNAYLNNGEGDAYVFYGMVPSSSSFKVKDAEFLDENSIVVKFTDVVDKESALEKSNYYLRDEDNHKVSVTTALLDEYDENYKYRKVILGTSTLKYDVEYTLTIDDVENLFKTSTIKDYDIDLGEADKGDDEVEIFDIEVLNRTTLELIFETPLQEKSENAYITIDNSVKIKEQIVSTDDPHKLLLYLSKGSPLKEDKEYELTIKKNIFDIYNNTIEDEIVEEFDGVDNVPDDITIDDAYFISDDQVIVKFSDHVRESSLKNEDNYTFEYAINGSDKKLFPGDIEIVDSKTVIIGFDYYLNGGKLYLTIDNVYDLSSQYQYNDLSIKVNLMED